MVGISVEPVSQIDALVPATEASVDVKEPESEAKPEPETKPETKLEAATKPKTKRKPKSKTIILQDE
jgi:hypothetical protein